MTKQYLRACERLCEIFQTRRKRDSIIRSLAADTKSDLASTWQEETNVAPPVGGLTENYRPGSYPDARDCEVKLEHTGDKMRGGLRRRWRTTATVSLAPLPR